MGAYDWVLGGPSIKKSLDNGAIFVSGAYPRRAPQIEDFAFIFGKKLAEREGTLVSGNGPTLGNKIVAGIQSVKGSETYQYTCIIPFKQHGTVLEMTHAQRSEYFNSVRHELIAKANIIVFMSGEKTGKDDVLVPSETVLTEYALGLEAGRWAIPVATLGGSAASIHEKIKSEIQKKLHPYKDLPAGLFDKLSDKNLPATDVVEAVYSIVDWIIEHKLTRSDSRRSSVSSKGDRPSHSRNVSGISTHHSPSGPAALNRSSTYARSPISAQPSRHASYAAASTEAE